MIIIIGIIVVLILLITGAILIICHDNKNYKVKGGMPTDPNCGSPVWNELYFSAPKILDEKTDKKTDEYLLNFLKDGVVCVNKESNKKDIKKTKEFETHSSNLKYFNKDKYSIHHYRIIFYDERIHVKKEDDVPISISEIPFEAEGIEKLNKLLSKDFYDDKLINKLKTQPIYKKESNEKIPYRHLRYEQVINAIFEYWFHICQYKYYYKTNHTSEIINSNIISDKHIKEYYNKMTKKDDKEYSNMLLKHVNKSFDPKKIKDNYEFLVYNDNLTLFNDESDIPELKESDRYKIPFKKLPYEWDKNDIKYICDLYILYLQLTFGDNFKYKNAKIKLSDKYIDVGFVKNLVSGDEFKDCLSKTGNIEQLNYFEVLTSGNINFANIHYTIEETIIEIEDDIKK